MSDPFYENRMGKFMREKLGVPVDFYTKLKGDDDWSFVVKLHALVESTILHILVSHFNDDRLLPLFAWMKNSDLNEGRLGFIRALELLDSTRINFVVQFSGLRNKFAHNVRHIPFTIDEFLKGSKQRENNLIDALTALYPKVRLELKFPDGKELTLTAKDQIERDGFRISLMIAVHTLTCDALKLDVKREGQPKLGWNELQVDYGQFDMHSISMPMSTD